MRHLLAALAISTALIAPNVAMAKNISTTVQMKSFAGPRAYVAVYLTKPNGQFHSTLCVMGGKDKYRRHLRGWFRGASQSNQRLDGITGASVGAGGSFTVKANIKDALLDAGYQIRVDTAVEDRGEFRSDAVVAMSASGQTMSSAGKGFIKSVKIQVQ